MIFRGVQGAGAAFLMPGSLSILTNTFKGPERGRALGLWAGISGMALGMGPVVGGLLVEKAGLGVDLLPECAGGHAGGAGDHVRRRRVARRVGQPARRRGRDPHPVGRPGVAGAGHGAVRPVRLDVHPHDRELVLAAVGLVAFGLLQWRKSEPMLDLDFFRDRNFNAGNVTAFLVSFSMFATFFFVTLYMQNILHLSALQTGVRFLPMTLLIIATAPIAGRLSDRYGSRGLLTIGMTLVATSLFLESRITDTSGYLTLLPAFLAGGVGMGMTMSPMTAVVMGSVDRAKAGAASGVLSMTRMIGGVFGVAALTAIFNHLSVSRAAGHTRADVFIYSLSHSLRYSAGIALVGAVVAVLFIRTHHEEQPHPAADPLPIDQPAFETGD